MVFLQLCEAALQKDPVGSAEKLKNLDAQSGPLAKVKNAAVSFLKSPGVKRFWYSWCCWNSRSCNSKRI